LGRATTHNKLPTTKTTAASLLVVAVVVVEAAAVPPTPVRVAPIVVVLGTRYHKPLTSNNQNDRRFTSQEYVAKVNHS
jgi:hypothetical protein